MTRPGGIDSPRTVLRNGLGGIGGAVPIPLLGQLGDVSTDDAVDGDTLVLDEGSGLWVPGSSTATGGFTPTYIAPGETFTVPADRQALFAMLIDVEGTLVVNGYLIEVN